MSKSNEIRDAVLEYLRSHQSSNIMAAPSARFDDPFIPLPYGAPGAKYAIDATFIAVLWELVNDGIIVPGSVQYLRGIGNEHAKTWPYYTITPYGAEVLAGVGATTSPRDASRFLEEARRRIPGGADAITLYLDEATRAFGARLYLSSVTMLGVSAEALMEWLIVIMRQHLASKPAQLSAFDKDLAKSVMRTSARFDRLCREIDAHGAELPRDLRELVNAQLVTVVNILKTYRDDVAHRRPFRVDPELADGQLRVYLSTLSVASELANALSAVCT